MRTLRSLTVPFTALLVLLALVASPLGVAAAGAKQFHDNFSNNVDYPDFCGFHVTGVEAGVTNGFVQPGDSVLPLFKGTGNFTGTYTNVDNGKQVVTSSAGQLRQISVVDNGAGYTFTVSNSGVPEKISGGNGETLVKDVGRLVRVIEVDYDFNFLSQTVTFEAGPHPEADSGFQLFCRAVSAALS